MLILFLCTSAIPAEIFERQCDLNPGCSLKPNAPMSGEIGLTLDLGVNISFEMQIQARAED